MARGMSPVACDVHVDLVGDPHIFFFQFESPMDASIIGVSVALKHCSLPTDIAISVANVRSSRSGVVVGASILGGDEYVVAAAGQLRANLAGREAAFARLRISCSQVTSGRGLSPQPRETRGLWNRFRVSCLQGGRGARCCF
eukprot:9461490-Lingulodinium_polyedra.AAC.1